MTDFRRWSLAAALITLFACQASGQWGVISDPPTANSLLFCYANAAGTPEIRPEGYTELLGDIVISCSGGPVSQVGTAIPTATIVVYISPAVPITSRLLGPGPGGYPGPSEVMLIIDEAGASGRTGATGGYGPEAPQSLCTTTQQRAGNACAAQVGLDKSGQYQVAVVPGTATPAQNVFQGSVGDFGFNSVAFYNVPVLAPAYAGVYRTFRITNIRIPTVGGVVNPIAQALVVTNGTAGPATLPMNASAMEIGVVGPLMRANVNRIPGDGASFLACSPQTSPTLVEQITFTEGFATGFKTRVVPGGSTNGIPGNNTGNRTWAAEAQNLVSPSNQNIPGGLYGGMVANSESGFILPAATFLDGTVTFTAGLADFGTRLKAVFSNIPAGVTLYVSTTSTGSVAIPGGTSLTPYAVLVGLSGDVAGLGSDFAPLTSAKVGSDGLFAFPLTPDLNTGVTAAVWEVVNANPSTQDALTFSVYAACGAPVDFSPPGAELSYAPEPGGKTFSALNETYGLTAPLPRFAVSPCANNGCALTADASSLSFSYTVGGPAPKSQYVHVTVVPTTLPVSVTPTVLSPGGGTWLAASLGTDGLYVTVQPWGLLPPRLNPYTGYVQIYAQNMQVQIPVSLTINPESALSIVTSHSGNFAAGQLGATYTIKVSNDTGAATSGPVTVTEYPPVGMTVVSMTSPGNAWTCGTSTCTIATSISPGQAYPPITVTVNVAPNTTSPSISMATVSGGGSANTTTATDNITVTTLACTITGDPSPSVADVQMAIGQALGIVRATYDFTSDNVANVADVQTVANAALGNGCQ